RISLFHTHEGESTFRDILLSAVATVAFIGAVATLGGTAFNHLFHLFRCLCAIRYIDARQVCPTYKCVPVRCHPFPHRICNDFSSCVLCGSSRIRLVGSSGFSYEAAS